MHAVGHHTMQWSLATIPRIYVILCIIIVIAKKLDMCNCSKLLIIQLLVSCPPPRIISFRLPLLLLCHKALEGPASVQMYTLHSTLSTHIVFCTLSGKLKFYVQSSNWFMTNGKWKFQLHLQMLFSILNMLCMSFFNLRKLIKVIKQNKQIFELSWKL